MSQDSLEEFICSKLPGAKVLVSGDRDGHNNHYHVSLTVISKEFVGKSIIEQHQMVMDILKEKLANEIHAVKIKTMVDND